jgi:hypothetical protein
VYVTDESGVIGLNFHQSKEVLITDSANGLNHFEVSEQVEQIETGWHHSVCGFKWVTGENKVCVWSFTVRGCSDNCCNVNILCRSLTDRFACNLPQYCTITGHPSF